MINKLSTLPHCELSLNVVGRTDAVYFRFNGGDGLVMQYKILRANQEN